MKAERVRANGILMQCVVEGPPSAQALLLCNGLATDLQMWEPQIGEFSKDYRVIRYDMRGHGETEASPSPYSLSLLVEDLRSLLDAIGVDQVHFAGMSLGGMVGQAFAVRYPQRLLSLALCDTAARMRREIWEGRIKQVEMEGVEPMVEPSILRWFTKPFRDANPALMDEIRQMIRRVSAQGYMGGARVVMEMNYVQQLAKISTPTLVIVGREDVSTPVVEAQLMHEHITGSTLCVIDDAAHLPNIERPEEFNRVLKLFLSRLDAVALEGGK
jgi:3-oxoadipate enol-lactonase